MPRYDDRTDAGRQLAALLDEYEVESDIVLAIPRGGLPVGRVVADALELPLDIVSARKIGAPRNPELAIGAVASDGTVWLNESLMADLGVADSYVSEQIEAEQRRALAKVDRYREGRPPVEFDGKTVIIVDDGVATGATTLACLRQVKNAGAERVVLAVPVGPSDTVDRLMGEADEVICVRTPPSFSAVGQFYRSFEQVADEVAKGYLRFPD